MIFSPLFPLTATIASYSFSLLLLTYSFKFFKASGLFVRIASTIGQVSNSGHSPQVETPFSYHIHSTMLLLYRRDQLRGDGRAQIYIPLCFYFIAPVPAACSRSSGFTFHYASTLSGSSPPASSPNPDLHSTMLLLYPCATRLPSSMRIIYIPLCFYFIGRGDHQRPGRRHIYIPLCFYFIQKSE